LYGVQLLFNIKLTRSVPALIIVFNISYIYALSGLNYN
jgi:hypothetical protein